jgi:hypothetical protein
VIVVAIVGLPREPDRPRADHPAEELHDAAASRVEEEIERAGQASRIPDLELRQRREAALAAAIPAEDIPAILGRLSESRRTSLYGSILLDRWTTAQPEAAAAWVDRHRGTTTYPRLLATVASAWAEEDETAAISWARGLDPEEDRAATLAEITTTMASHEPVVALELAAEAGRPGLIHDVLRTWAQRDPAEAARWAESRSSDQERASAVTEVALEWARSDSLAAAGLVLDATPGREPSDQTLVSVISRAGSADLPELREWIDTFPHGPLKDLSRAELTRIERLLPSAPASLPGEDDENRTPHGEIQPKTR